MFRNYNDFGLITDNRNYSYKKLHDNNIIVGDKIVSDIGAIFLSVLSQRPQQIEEIVNKLIAFVPDVEHDTIHKDAVEFYDFLENEGFLVSGNTPDECCQNDKKIFKGVNGEKACEKTEITLTENKYDTQDYFDNYFGKKPQLRNIHIEITSVCNERCIHCYIPHEYKNRHMKMDLFNKILFESKEMNLLNFTLTGGEPMLHPNFLEMIDKCKKENISLNILSNLTVLSEEIVNGLKNNPLINIQTSLYSMDPEIHDEITKIKGSFNLTKDAIKKLVSNNVNLQICCPIMKQNMYCYRDVIEWAKKMNIEVSSDYVIIGRYNSDMGNLNCRLSYDDVHKIEINHQLADLDFLNKEIEEKKRLTLEDNICTVCRYSFCISENGEVYPCAGWQSYVVGNSRKSTIGQIWEESPKIKYLQNLKIKDFKACVQCDDRIYCSICMVRNANENSSGDPKKVSKYHCEIARLKKNIYIKHN